MIWDYVPYLPNNSSKRLTDLDSNISQQWMWTSCMRFRMRPQPDNSTCPETNHSSNKAIGTELLELIESCGLRRLAFAESN